VYFIVNGTPEFSVETMLQPPSPSANTTSNTYNYIAQTSTLYTAPMPANATAIQLVWTDNEEDQNGNPLCTPNAKSYDPDLQINSIFLTS
jgi:hypothetical protein